MREKGKADVTPPPQWHGRYRLYDELRDADGDCANFSSFLRLGCGRHLALQVSGRIPADAAVPIRSLDADWVLAGEKARPGVFTAPPQRTGMAQATR